MKLKLSFLFLLFHFTILAQCPPGNVDINSQAEVIAFAAEYPNCTQINGFLSFTGSDITDLTPLNYIVSVFGSLNINSTAITNGNIFNNLTTVTGLLNIQNNPNLTQISGFNALVNGSTVQINSNTNLTQITGFTSLTTLSNNLSFIGAAGSPVLTNISGFSNVESVGYLLVRNTGLTNLSSLSSLQAINLGMSIDQNPNLTSIAALNNCTNAMVGNGTLPFRIFNNPLLQSLEGINFSSVTNIFDVQIFNLPLVQNIDQLSCLEGNIPAVMIRDMSNLQNLNGLSNITSIGSLNLSNLNLVNSLPSWNLSQLNAFTISNNAQLSSINTLSNVLVLGSGAELNAITLNNNPQLLDLNGLHNLVSLSNKSAIIINNTALSDISALNNLNVSTLNGITLTGNTSLSTCNEEWICERLELNLDNINISNNAIGCESISTVQATCTPELCPSGNVNLVSQDDVNSFIAQYPNCTFISGTLGINGITINNIEGLSNITSVSGNLVIQNSSLTNLNGLQNLSSVNGFTISGNSVLTDISQLTGISGVLNGNVSISLNSALSSLNGLQNITQLSRMTIANNPVLTSLLGLQGLTTITSQFNTAISIDNNSNLTSLNGLQNVANFPFSGGIRIVENQNLTDISALENVGEFGTLEITNNLNLSECSIVSFCTKLALSTSDVIISDNAVGCESITTVIAGCEPCPTGSVFISSLSELNNFLAQYPNCTTINGGLTITGEDILNLDGLNGIETINGWLYIYNLPQLTSIQGLSNVVHADAIFINNIPSLTSLNGLNQISTTFFVYLQSLPSLSNLDGLNGITNLGELGNRPTVESFPMAIQGIGGGLFVFETGITSINALSNLVNVNGYEIMFVSNPNLTDISGLENINPQTVGSLSLTNNNNLDSCSIPFICSVLSVLDENSVNISNNSANCNSRPIVEDICETLSIDSVDQHNTIITYPNPFKNSINVVLGQGVSNVKINLFDSTGKQYYSKTHIGEIIEINQLDLLSSGMYFISIELENGNTITQKIVK